MSQKSSHTQKSSLIEISEIRDYDTYRVMSLTPLLPYHVVADVGCGSGYLTIPLAKYLFDGKVYAVDNSKDMLDNTKSQMECINLTNISLIKLKISKKTDRNIIKVNKLIFFIKKNKIIDAINDKNSNLVSSDLRVLISVLIQLNFGPIVIKIKNGITNGIITIL